MVIDDVKPITEKVLIETLHDVLTELVLPRFEQIEKRLDSIERRLDSLEKDVSELKADMHDVRRRLDDLERDTPSSRDLQTLTKRVEKLEHAVGL